MILIPAIDIKNGKVVRLFQGKFSEVTEYSDDPLQVAKKWESLGAQWLHLVDLDGAKDGVMANKEIIKNIARSVKIPVQAGGGIRTLQVIEDLLTNNISRIVLGTSAAIDIRGEIEKSFAISWVVKKYGNERLAVSLDCLNGFIAERGWTETSHIKDVDLAKWIEGIGVKTIIYTDVTKDGTLQGPNFLALENILESTKMDVIASGGIATIEDVRKLSLMKGIVGAITGKAIYEGKLDFKKALKVCG